jgi:hypothetical protein
VPKFSQQPEQTVGLSRSDELLARVVDAAATGEVRRVPSGLALAYRSLALPGAGKWVGPHGNTTVSGTNNGNAHVCAWLLPEAVRFDAFRIEVTSVGAVGATVRALLYANDPDTDRPGELVYASAQQPANVAQITEVLLAQPVEVGPGWVWTGTVTQNAASSLPTLRAINPIARVETIERTSTLGTAIAGYQFPVGATTEEPPATAPASPGVSGGVGLVFWRVAA